MSWKDERPSGCRCPTAKRSNPNCRVHGTGKEDRWMANEDLRDELRESVAAAMHQALLTAMSPEHVKKEAWEAAVHEVGYAADKQLCKLLGVKAPRRSR